MSKLNARRNSRSTRNGPSSPNLLWTFSDITLQSTITVGWDGTIFAAEADRIIAFFPNGRVRWRKDFPREISLAGCALGADGTLLVVSERGYLLAYWPNGTLRWVHKHPDAYISLHARPLVSADGTVYSGGQTEMVSLRPNGRVNWRFAARTEGEPAQGADGAIYFPSESYLYALNPEGSLRWRTFVTGDYGIGSAPAVAEDGTIYVTTVLGSLAAVNPNGSMKWMFPRSGGVADVPTPPALGADGTIYYGATDNYFYAVNPDGSEKWRFRPDSRSGFHYAPATVGGDGTIYVGANVPDFYALKPDGSVRWHFQVPYDPFLGTYVRSQPVLVEAGRLLIGSLFALQALGPEPA
jgi:outer membrane protein assembly factor BamB